MQQQIETFILGSRTNYLRFVAATRGPHSARDTLLYPGWITRAEFDELREHHRINYKLEEALDVYINMSRLPVPCTPPDLTITDQSLSCDESIHSSDDEPLANYREVIQQNPPDVLANPTSPSDDERDEHEVKEPAPKRPKHSV